MGVAWQQRRTGAEGRASPGVEQSGHLGGQVPTGQPGLGKQLLDLGGRHPLGESWEVLRAFRRNAQDHGSTRPSPFHPDTHTSRKPADEPGHDTALRRRNAALETVEKALIRRRTSRGSPSHAPA